MQKLKCGFQNYAWGKHGMESTVAQIVKEGRHAESVDEAKPYAELWMGVHPNGPSIVCSSNIPLADYIKSTDGSVGVHEEGTLQFLFKVLSVRSALSVQTHPTKKEAVLLHASDPKNYPDSNHKPEMAIALTDFQLLCGFRPTDQIIANIKDCPEFQELLGTERILLKDLESQNENTRNDTLKKIFTRVWNSSSAQLSEEISKLIARLKAKDKKSNLDELLIRLDSEYPGGDVGVFAPLLLNYFTLKPGQATFLGPNIPHAYLFGDCIECMACSDNTIRAGLTPKFKDVKTLCANLNYTMSPPPLFNCKDAASGTLLYNPPTPEFAVERITAEASTFTSSGYSSLIIIVSGSSHFSSGQSLEVRRGDVIFIPSSLKSVTIDSTSPDFIAFRAYTPSA